TDEIERFTVTGIRLKSGREIKSDLVVSATGLVVKLLGGVELTVDGARVDPSERLICRGMMLSDVPNLTFAFGYTNASWTLKCDLTSRSLCRLLRHMRRHDFDICRPATPGPDVERRPMLDFSSTYVRRA